MIYDAKKLQEILPHRYPFLMIDCIEDMVPGQSATGIKNVTFNEYYFQGHFPGNPVMPGVLIIEAMAQTGAAAILSMEQFKGRTAYFGGIKNAKFKRKVVPGDTLRIETKITRLAGTIGLGSAKAYVGEELASEAELYFGIE